MYLLSHSLLVGELVAQHVQCLAVRLLLRVSRDAEARPVVAPLAVVFVQVPEVCLHRLCLCVLHSRGCQLVAHGEIERGHGLDAVVVALQLVGSQHLPRQLRAVLCRVAQCLSDEGGRFVRAYRVAYRVVAAGVEHHFQAQAVRVGGHVVALRVFPHCLVEQLAVPAVQRPHKERRAWSPSLHLHTPFVPEVRCAASARCRHEVELFFPHAHSAGGYPLPALHIRYFVVVVRYHGVVEVVVVCYHLREHGLFLPVVHLGGVRVLKLLADEYHRARLLVFVELHVQPPCVLRQAVRPCVRYAGQCRRCLCPELTELYLRLALADAVAVRAVYAQPESVHYGAVVGVFRLLLVAQVPPVGQHIVRIILHRLAVWLYRLHKWLAVRLFLCVGVAAVNLCPIF